MHVVARKKILDFEKSHPDVKSALDTWYIYLAKKSFSSSDAIPKQFCFVDILPLIELYLI
jgi:mRNA-degrading endonuclease HigB of HigAB toxin-antitoxin module